MDNKPIEHRQKTVPLLFVVQYLEGIASDPWIQIRITLQKTISQSFNPIGFLDPSDKPQRIGLRGEDGRNGNLVAPLDPIAHFYPLQVVSVSRTFSALFT